MPDVSLNPTDLCKSLLKMKTLYLVRHAKSSWEEPGIPDSERTLTTKGILKTGKIVGFLRQRNTSVGILVSSPARRALETARILADGLGYPVSGIRTERRIYDGSYDRILDIIYGTPNDLSSLMIVGHNPTLTNLANLFLHPGIENMPTSCVVALSFNVDAWEEIHAAEAIREFIVFPKMLK